MWPEKFNNKTNGVTPRRWIASSNPAMSQLITDTIGPGWITDLPQLRKLMPYAEEKFRAQWRVVKRANKVRLAELVQRVWRDV